MGRSRLQELRHHIDDKDNDVEEKDDEVELRPLNPPVNNIGVDGNNVNTTGDEDFDEQTEKAAMEYLAQYDLIISRLESLRTNVDSLRSLQSSLLTSTYRREEDEKRVEKLVKENQQLAQSIQKDLKSEQQAVAKLEQRQQRALEDANNNKTNRLQKLQVWVSNGKKGKGFSDEERTELRLRRTQMQAQSRRFFELWQEYNEQQIEFRDRSKKLLIRRAKVANANFTDEQIEQMLDDNKHADVFATSILDQSRMARQQLSDLQERHDDLIKLEQSLEEMHAMFVDLATLVQDQGETVNTIARHVELATVDVEQGRDHLNKAKAAQKAARRKRIWCFTILFIVVFIILLVLAIDLGLLDLIFKSSDEGSSNAKVIEKIYIPVTEEEKEKIKREQLQT